MASNILRSCSITTNLLLKTYQSSCGSNVATFVFNGSSNLLQIQSSQLNKVRYTSFFNKIPAEYLWKGVTSVSNAGRRRGRAKAVGKSISVKDLHRGQKVGCGKINIQWPGLNVPIIQGKEINKQHRLPDDPKREQQLIELRDKIKPNTKFKLTPLERGWSGGKSGGRRIGPPDPVGEDKFEGFDTWVVESKTVTNMTGNMGRKTRASAFVVTGNKNGLAGFALRKAGSSFLALRASRNRAGQKLMYIPRYKEHTVLHDFFTQFGRTKVFVSKMHEGYGLVCHRAIKVCCEAMGIKDLYAKVEGSTNVQHIVKAFFLGLLQQKDHQKIVDDKKLHLVEFRKEMLDFPIVVASPATVRKTEEIQSNEILDFKQYCMEGRVVAEKRKKKNDVPKNRVEEIRCRKHHYLKNQDEVRIRLYAEYGSLCSFLTENYPEARFIPFSKKRQEENTEN